MTVFVLGIGVPVVFGLEEKISSLPRPVTYIRIIFGCE